MKALDFKTWLAQLNALNRRQKNRLRNELDRQQSAAEVGCWSASTTTIFPACVCVLLSGKKDTFNR